MTLTVTDLFAGAGGSSQGMHAVPGVEVRIAANHWKLAVESHAANFPDTEHDCADISQVDVRRYPNTDILWASPECTNHSQAKGVKRATHSTPDMFGEVLPDAAAERSRATMWDVPRFAEQIHYRAIIVENVVDAVKWVMFPAWLHAMTLLGYEHQMVSLNSMHAQATRANRAPQSRDRLYVVFNRRGDRRPDVTPRPLALCGACGHEGPSVQVWKRPENPVGRYRAQYFYQCSRCTQRVEPFALPAAAAIDWSMPGQRIGDRVKPLSPKTMARIEAGLRKYGSDAYLTVNRGGPFAAHRNIDVSSPVPTIVASPNPIGLVVPVEGRDGKQAMPAGEPMRTLTTRAETALVVPYYGSQTTARSAGEPMPTMGTVDTAALVVPSGGTWNESAYPVSDPFRTQTTREHEGVAFIAELRGGGSDHRPVTEPLATVVASGNHHMLVRHNSSRSGAGAEMCTPASEPARTLTTSGHQSLVSIASQVEDASFRMLEPHEIQAAMAFGADYRVLGNRRERVRQLGNAVTPPAAEFLVGAVAEALQGAS